MTLRAEPTASRAIAIGVCIVNFFSANDTVELLRSLANFAEGGASTLRICVVDNSRDLQELATLNAASERYANNPQLTIVLVDALANLGYAAGNNLAAKTLEAFDVSHYWILNPDARVCEGTLDDSIKELLVAGVGIFSTLLRSGQRSVDGVSRFNLTTSRATQAGTETQHERSSSRSIFYPDGHSIIVPKQVWNTLSGFNEKYFLYMEEVDLACRATRAGLELKRCRSLAVTHVGAVTTSKSSGEKSELTFFESSRSRALFYRQYYTRRIMPFVFLRTMFALIRGIRDPRQGNAIILGIISGLVSRNRRAAWVARDRSSRPGYFYVS